MAPVSTCALNSCSFAMSAFFDIKFSLQPLTGPFIEHFLPGLLFLFALAGAGVPASRTRRFQFSPSTASLNPERFLATGNSYQSLSYSFRVGKSTISQLVPKVCQAIWTVLQPRFLKPLHEQGIEAIAEQFWCKWNFPNCAGAIDGKHIRLDAPPNSGTLYFNYKQGFSINLMASCDASYKFTSVYIGCYGRESDGGVFAASQLGIFVDNGHKNLPDPCELPNGGPVLPYVFVADDAFPLKTNLMKLYPGTQGANSAKRIYNYRLSRARRRVDRLVATVLRSSQTPLEAQESSFQVTGVTPPQAYSRRAADVRDSFASYFHGPGAVPWQFT
ncbi:hypothetical protein MRX96_028909 [Rhipicephalus microplus]